ncbi:MAG TPA: hypothetical protein VKQ27_03765 [Acetobacteraceae bacterium]|nr:hypothetical protein [Acetobacteraceae bacterium]
MLDPAIRIVTLTVTGKGYHGPLPSLLAPAPQHRRAANIANHVVVFKQAAIIEQGPPRPIFEAPLERTRDFLSHLGWEG